jgi:hypothetical protein
LCLFRHQHQHTNTSNTSNRPRHLPWLVEDELIGMQMADWPASMVQAGKRLLQVGEGRQTLTLTRRRNIWMMASSMSSYPLFSTAAMRLLLTPPYTSLRNKLEQLTAEKMIFIKANMLK